MQFRYRFVNYGTLFYPADGSREVNPATIRRPDTPEAVKTWEADRERWRPAKLFANELVTDVGGMALGYDGCKLAIVDHHFTRKDGGNFPSASAGVLHLAKQIRERFVADEGTLRFDTVATE